MIILLNVDTPLNDVKLRYEVDPKHYVTYTDKWVVVINEKHRDVVRFNRYNVVAVYENK